MSGYTDRRQTGWQLNYSVICTVTEAYIDCFKSTVKAETSKAMKK